MRLLPLACGVFIATPALAAGGAHIVDDASVETPGVCHLEAYASRYDPQDFLLSGQPACTFTALPDIEFDLGGTFARSGGATQTGGALGLKVATELPKLGVAVGARAGTGFRFDLGKFDTFSALALLTKPIGKAIEINFNIGWYRQNSNGVSGMTGGAQTMLTLSEHWQAMAEIFARHHLRTGTQTGLRRTGKNVDIDILYGHYVDGSSPHAITIGVTFRNRIAPKLPLLPEPDKPPG